jgi:glycosyltransferase involved in cell wall biosynthesis
MLTTASTLAKANAALRDNQFADAMRLYLEVITDNPGLSDIYSLNIGLVARRYTESRRGSERLRVGICGWELSHNAAGRAYTLASMYRTFADTEIIGCLFSEWGDSLWEPIRNTRFPVHSILIDDGNRFFTKAVKLVASHPYDIVHLSKPRAPNILIGMLYKLIWNARVLVDIDDEELAITKASAAISPEEYLQNHQTLPPLSELPYKRWTEIAVGMVNEFDGITVSNEVLQHKYGGEILYHARNSTQFDPAALQAAECRSRFGIPPDKLVVLFFGTGRKHKGLLDIARAISALDRQDLVFVLAGDMEEKGLAESLLGIENCDCIFLGMQPFESIAQVVATADICILCQNPDSPISGFQLPAKLTDALAMGKVVLANRTPPMEFFIRESVVVEFEHDLTATLTLVVNNLPDYAERAANGRALFLSTLSTEANATRLQALVSTTPNHPFAIQRLFEAHLGKFPFSTAANVRQTETVCQVK